MLYHVQNPMKYLHECYRVLKPGGYLVLTTHGTYEDHACPHDYWRWTVFGLQRIVEEAGFKVRAVKKATTGPRAAVFLSEREQWELNFTSHRLYDGLLSFGIRVGRRLGSRRLHEAADRSFPNHRVVDGNQDGHKLYLIAAVLASRQDGPSPF